MDDRRHSRKVGVVDEDGVVFKVGTASDLDLPVVSGLSAGDMALGAQLPRAYRALFADLRASGANSVRWWVFTDGRGAPEFNGGFVTGFDANTLPSMADAIKLTQYFRDLRHYPFYNRVRSLFYPANPPASTVVEVSRFMPGDAALIEVEAVIHVKPAP